jgi:hypothetical protein
MFDTSVLYLLLVTPPNTIPKISENNPGPKLPPKRTYVSIASVQKKAAKAAKSQKVLNFGS